MGKYRDPRGLPPLQLCLDKVQFYSHYVEFWQAGDKMPLQWAEQCLEWWKRRLEQAERRHAVNHPGHVRNAPLVRLQQDERY